MIQEHRRNIYVLRPIGHGHLFQASFLLRKITLHYLLVNSLVLPVYMSEKQIQAVGENIPKLEEIVTVEVPVPDEGVPDEAQIQERDAGEVLEGDAAGEARILGQGENSPFPDDVPVPEPGIWCCSPYYIIKRRSKGWVSLTVDYHLHHRL